MSGGFDWYFELGIKIFFDPKGIVHEHLFGTEMPFRNLTIQNAIRTVGRIDSSVQFHTSFRDAF